MTTRRWVLPVVVTTLVVGTGGAVAALAGGGRVQETQPVTRAEIFYGSGPSATYAGDAGTIGGVAALRLTTPTDAASYDAVVEVSYDTRTRGPGPFVLQVTVDTGEADGQDDPTTDDLRTRPAGPATIDPGGAAGPATARWLVRGLDPGTTYRVGPSVNSRFRERGTNAVRLRDTLVTVELAPTTR